MAALDQLVKTKGVTVGLESGRMGEENDRMISKCLTLPKGVGRSGSSSIDYRHSENHNILKPKQNGWEVIFPGSGWDRE